jgi:hypothetical protein
VTTTWTYVSNAGTTGVGDAWGVIDITGDATQYLSVGDRLRFTNTTAKQFLLHQMDAYEAHDAGETRIYVYGGTLNALANAAISGVSYSHEKSPYGFPLSAATWTATFTDTSDRSQSSPTDTPSTWYNVGTLQLTIPPGPWTARYSGLASVTGTSVGTGLSSFAGIRFTLSTANNTESNAAHTCTALLGMLITDSTSGHSHRARYDGTVQPPRPIPLTIATSAQTWHLNMATFLGAPATNINLFGTLVPTVITATSAVL